MKKTIILNVNDALAQCSSLLFSVLTQFVSSHVISSLLCSFHLILFFSYISANGYPPFFSPYSHHCSLIKVSDDHHRPFLGYSCCYGDRDKNRHCYSGGLHGSQWVPCQFVTLTMFLIPPWTHLFLSLSVCLAVSVLSTHIFPSCLSVPLSLSGSIWSEHAAELWKVGTRSGCEEWV